MSILILPVPELPRIAVAVQIPTLPEPELCGFCGEPGLHHHSLERFRVTFDSAAIVVRTPIGLIQSEVADWAWEELGGSLPRPRFISVEFLSRAWSDDSARGRSEIEWHKPDFSAANRRAAA